MEKIYSAILTNICKTEKFSFVIDENKFLHLSYGETGTAKIALVRQENKVERKNRFGEVEEITTAIFKAEGAADFVAKLQAHKNKVGEEINPAFFGADLVPAKAKAKKDYTKTGSIYFDGATWKVLTGDFELNGEHVAKGELCTSQLFPGVTFIKHKGNRGASILVGPDLVSFPFYADGDKVQGLINELGKMFIGEELEEYINQHLIHKWVESVCNRAAVAAKTEPEYTAPDTDAGKGYTITNQAVYFNDNFEVCEKSEDAFVGRLVKIVGEDRFQLIEHETIGGQNVSLLYCGFVFEFIEEQDGKNLIAAMDYILRVGADEVARMAEEGIKESV